MGVERDDLSQRVRPEADESSSDSDVRLPRTFLTSLQETLDIIRANLLGRSSPAVQASGTQPVATDPDPHVESDPEPEETAPPKGSR